MVRAGFIPGIYNYCDRWCEKCSQQSRCVSYVIGKKLDECDSLELFRKGRKKSKSLWNTLKRLFDSTLEVLDQVADERGISVAEIFEAEHINGGLWEEAYIRPEAGTREFCLVERTDIVMLGLLYEKMGDECMNRILQTFTDEESVGGSEWDNAWDQVTWDLNLVKSKIRQALYRKYCSGKKRQEEECNGLAKMALILIDRDLKAWPTVGYYYPECLKETEELMGILGQLKVDVEREFPEARAFLRPGFDKPVVLESEEW